MAYLNKVEMKQYLSNALECIEFKLVRDRSEVDDDIATVFRPEFAHQIFGESECIFGYKDLKIRLFYTAGPLNMYFGTKYTSRINDIQNDGLKGDDVVGAVSKLLTTGCYYTNIDEFLAKLDKEESFQPFGEKVYAWKLDTENNAERHFEIYECNVHTPGFLAFHARLQTFLLWFVDAASFIDTNDSQWLFLVAYEKYKSKNGKTMYATVGYSTVYLYYAYPQNVRPRISQMLVLPPFQGMGIGAQLIETVYRKFKGDDKVIDITVEDPSDDFRRVRNYVDAKLCRQLPEFQPERLKDGFTKVMIAAARNHYKINPRQCRNIYEILRLMATNLNDSTEYQEYRLCVKKRLNAPHHKQKQDLKKVEKRGIDITAAKATIPTTDERIEQLKEEYQAHEEEYFRIINRLKSSE